MCGNVKVIVWLKVFEVFPFVHCLWVKNNQSTFFTKSKSSLYSYFLVNKREN